MSVPADTRSMTMPFSSRRRSSSGIATGSVLILFAMRSAILLMRIIRLIRRSPPFWSLPLMGQTMKQDDSEMSEKPSQTSETFSVRRTMAFTSEADRTEMRDHVGAIVSLVPDRSRKAAIQFAAGLLRLPVGRVKSLFYGEARRIDAHEADQIRAYVQQAETLIRDRQDYENRLASFLSSAPRFVARLSPPSLPPVEVRQEVAADHAASGGRR